MTRRLNVVLLAVLLAAGISFYWLFLSVGTEDAQPKPIAMATLRSIAARGNGALPTAIQFEEVGYRSIQSNRLAAGTGLRESHFTLRAFLVHVPDRAPVLIDGGALTARQRVADLEEFDEGAQGRIARAAKSASLVVTLARAGQHDASLRIDEQPAIAPPERAVHALAPGIVAIPTEDLGPGSQMLYVRLADGHEFLFAGDAAYVTKSWKEVRPPARWQTRLNGDGRRRIIASWLMTINALHREAPQMTIVAGHDQTVPENMRKGFRYQQRNRLQKAGQAAGHAPRDNVLARQKS